MNATIYWNNDRSMDTQALSWQRPRSSTELRQFIDKHEALLQMCIGCDEM